MNPYDNNPFENNEPRELKNEYDANRELAKEITDDVIETIDGIFGTMTSGKHGFWNFK